MSGYIGWLNSVSEVFTGFAGRMLVQSSVLILILLLLDLVLRRRVRAVVRYWIWLLVLAKLLLPPSLSAPTSLVAWLGSRLPEATTAPFVPSPRVVTQDVLEAPLFLPMATVPQPSATDFPTIGAAPMPGVGTAPVVSPTWQAMVLLGWAAAVVLMLLLLLQRISFIRALLTQSQEAPIDLSVLLEQCRRQMGIRRQVEIRLTCLSASPSVCGLRRPVILMPEHMMQQLQTSQLRSVLLHELAHIQRGDLWISLLQTLLQIAYFYHPLLWPANMKIRRIREQAVDEAVLAAMGEEAEEYPRTLLNISRLAFGQPALSLRLLGVVESKRALTARIRHIVSRPFPTSARLGLLGLVAIAIIAIVLLPMARGTEGGIRDTPPDKPADPFVVTSRPGMRIELLGVRVYSEADQPWWRADGSPATGTDFPKFQEFRTPLPSLNDPKARVRALALRLTGASLEDVSVSWSLPNARGSHSMPYFPIRYVHEADEREVLRRVQTIVARFADDATTTDLKFGVAAGPWKDVATESEGRTTIYAKDNITQNDVIYHPAEERDGSLIMAATHLLGGNYDCRIVAEDENHHILEPIRSNNSGGRCLSVLKVTRAQVKSFRLQARPYEWVEFKGVRLAPEPKEADTAERIIHFPKERSLGLLSLRSAHADEWEKWRERGQARGDTPVPEGTQRRLSVTEKTYENLADLATLRADDLQDLYLSSPQLQDDDLRHLKGLTGLQFLTLSSGSNGRTCPMNGEGLAYLRDLKSLRHLRILFTQITDESLRHLEPLSRLEDLTLWNDEQIHGQGLGHLQSLPALRSLSFYQVPVEDAGLEKLKGMEQLESLSLQYTRVTDEGLAHLRGLPALQSLVLPPATTDTGLAHLRELASLTELSISDARVTDDGLIHLREMPALTSVHISCRQMDGRGLKYLHGLPGLKKIGLMYDRMNDAGMEGLRGLKAVTSLHLGRNPITDSGLANLEGLTALEYLHLNSTPITDAGLVHLGGLTSLKLLDLESTRITAAGLENLRDLTGLQTLRLVETDISDAGLAHLTGLKALDTLYLDGTKVSDAGLIHVGDLPLLRHLTLRGTSITEEGLVHLEDSRSLRHLSVGVPRLSQAGLGHLRQMTWLQELSLAEGSLREEDLADLEKALPDCAINVSRVYAQSPRLAPTSPAGQPATTQPSDSSAVASGAGMTATAPAPEDDGAGISGLVVDAAGKPIVGARVRVENKDLLLLPQPVTIHSEVRQVARPEETETDSQGRFRFTDLAPGKTGLRVSARGHRTEFVAVATGTEGLRVVLGEPRPYRLSGVALDMSCRPVAGVEVTFIEETVSGPGQGSEASSVTLRTDDRGAYRFDRLLSPGDEPSVRRFLYARKAGYGAWGMQCDTTGGQPSGVIRLLGEEKVSGVVKNESGAPIAGATVVLFSGWGHQGPFYFAPAWQRLAPQAVTRTDGTFTLDQLPTDSYLSLRVHANGYASDGLWSVRTGQVGNPAMRDGDKASVPLTITLSRAALPPGATAGPKTQWLASEGGNGHFYQAVRMSKPLPWNEADRLARALGGHLVTLTSKAENDFVFRLVDNDTYWYHSYNWRGPWIGALQPPGSAEPAGGWTWVTGEPFSYAIWDAGQPNNFNGSPENRLHFGNQRSRIPTWNDVRENFEEVISFVVEFPDTGRP
jgi:beta-lactamase regulating signal transducer with metallopeptidase domain/Leucine-rich repeat (LRR) protein